MPEGRSEPPAPRIDQAGDAALIASLGDDLDIETSGWALRAAAWLERRRAEMPGLGAPVPGHASVLVSFEPDRMSENELRNLLLAALAGTRQRAQRGRVTRGEIPLPFDGGVRHEIPVSYGGSDGPDLAEVAGRTGLSEKQVIALHASVEYRVLVVGFMPGFPYLGFLPAALDLPRRATPRVRVPAGSVAIAGRQAGIYPFETPGGWHLIGRTDAALWDPGRDPPALLAPGDRVRFVPIPPRRPHP